MTDIREKTGAMRWLIAVLSHWRMLVLHSVLAALLVFGISFLLPKWYRSTIEIFPPYNAKTGIMGMSEIGGIISGLGGGGEFTLPFMATQSDLWEAMLKSPGVLDSVVIREKLVERYNKKNIKDARERLLKLMHTDVNGQGIVTISVEDRDPRYAAHLATVIVERLDAVNRSVKQGAAHETKIFTEKRLRDIRSEMSAWQDSLIAFQKKYKAISIEDQARLALENAAQIEAELIITDVDLGVANRAYGIDHSRVRNLIARKEALRKKLSEMEYKSDSTGIIQPLALMDVPELVRRYTNILRENTAIELVYQYLRQQYEQSLIDEQQDIPIIKVLSPANVPVKKSRPHRIINGLVAGVSVFLLELICLTFLFTLRNNPQIAEIARAMKKRQSKNNDVK